MATSSQGEGHPSSQYEDSNLVSSLYSLSKKSPKLVKSTAFFTSSSSSGIRNVEIRSWKMNEYKYSVTPCPFPTLARGLFTRELRELSKEQGDGTGGGEGLIAGMAKFVSGTTQSSSSKAGKKGKEKEKEKHYQILVRGYDKFFNIDEVPWTSWSAIEANTLPPYTLSLKSNGCIIFISALTSSKLLITSKHSLGPIEGYAFSHAEVGEQWLKRYMEDSDERSEECLAKELWENNWTAVAELCDDSFEEHVLAYPPEQTGLHLHGINVRTKDFATMPTKTVDAFAEKWGFIRTPTLVLHSAREVKEFTDQCAKKGEWKGEPVEGFVVRTTIRATPIEEAIEKSQSTKSGASSSNKTAKPPYPPDSSFFFKVKFDEPYMMYRDWREITKTLVSVHSKFGVKALNNASSHLNLSKQKLKRPETSLYLDWVVEEIRDNPKSFEGYLRGKGIVSSREKFLAWMKQREGEN